MAFHPNHLSQHQHFSHTTQNNSTILPDHHHHHQSVGKDHWLNSEILRQQGGRYGQDSAATDGGGANNLLNNNNNNSDSQLSRSMMQRNVRGGGDHIVSQLSNDSIMAAAAMSSPTDLTNQPRNIVAGGQVDNNGGGDSEGEGALANWQNARSKAEVLSHPLYEQLLSAHVSCLRIATPVDQLPRIDAQLAQSQHVVSKYSALAAGHSDDKELDQFMVLNLYFPQLPHIFAQKILNIITTQNQLKTTVDVIDGPTTLSFEFLISYPYGMGCYVLKNVIGVVATQTHYVLLLCSFKEQLQQHVRVHAMEAVMACWEIEQSLQSLTGASPGEGTGATMSDDDDDQVESDANLFDGSLDGHDTMGFGPLVPTESERSLMERVRQELKHELKQGYKEKIVDIREEILRKRRAGKLPGDTTSVLKSWWQSHAKWPYPTEEDKARLVQETGLQLKQINNWFINQRKRNWHTNPSTSSTVLKAKRKR